MDRAAALPVVFAAIAMACGAQSGSIPEAVDGRAQPSAARNVLKRAHSKLERKYTGQGVPTILIHNSFPVTQHVFIDGEHLGSVKPGSRATFAVLVGTHTLTGADSADQDHNPVSVTEIFETGFSYTYEILPEE